MENCKKEEYPQYPNTQSDAVLKLKLWMQFEEMNKSHGFYIEIY